MTTEEMVQAEFEVAVNPVLEAEGFAYSNSQFAWKRRVHEGDAKDRERRRLAFLDRIKSLP